MTATSTPPLRHGDRLSRDEFERRYNAMPELKKAELFEGTVFIDPRHGQFRFGEARAVLIGSLGFYSAYTDGLRVSANATLRLDHLNEPQPDAVIRLLPERGGKAWVDPEGFLNGGPELVADASPFPEAHRAVKMRVYQQFGVREYIVWRVEEQAIDWHVLRGSRYDLLQPDKDGLLKSEVFPGLWLDPMALIERNPARIHAVVQQGLASPEHPAFVAHLQQTSTP